MFCPNCGNQTNEPLKFCKQCGANLNGVREAMLRKGEAGGIDWSKTWVAEMFMTEEERERQRGTTPEEKRYNEIKGGIITSLVGLGVMIFLYHLLNAIAAQEPHDAELLRKVWLAGLIPFLVGVGIIINGLFISKRIVELKRQPPLRPPQPTPLSTAPVPQLSEPAATPLSAFSVTETTTTRLPEPVPTPTRRDTN